MIENVAVAIVDLVTSSNLAKTIAIRKSKSFEERGFILTARVKQLFNCLHNYYKWIT